MTNKDVPPPPSTATSRLSQITSHISPSSSSTTPSPPADWSDVLSELAHVRTLAQTPQADTTGYQRHKQAGKLWVRERIELLVDRGSFREVGSAAGSATWRKKWSGEEVTEKGLGVVEGEKEVVDGFTASNNVQGFGKVGGRKVLLTADDFTLRAGHADGALMPKTLYMEKLCLHLKLPMVKLVDGASGGGSITTYRQFQGTYLPDLELLKWVVKELDQGIPQVAAVVGPAVGLGAARAAVSHFSVIAADIGSLFNAGPKIVEGATFEEDLSFADLGGPGIHCANGVIDNVAPDEKGCYEQIARFLSYVPNHGGVLPPVIKNDDAPNRHCPELRTAIPRRAQRMYEVRNIIKEAVDRDTFFEIGPHWGKTIVVGLARMAGRTVGIFANDAMNNAGALDSAGSQKYDKHIRLCDCMGIPIVQFIDIPGFAIGTVAEKGGVMKWGLEMYKTLFGSTIPIFSVVIRRCYGIGGSILADCRDPNCRVAWPSGNWGSIPLDGGIEVNHRAELKRAGDKKPEVYAHLEAEYMNLQNPVRTANRFSIEEIIDPADTRSVVCAWTKHMYEHNLVTRLEQRAAGFIKPSFR
ncbi:propionyl-CoA carboxylase beta chain [Eremomyces bilateralis CBS 781.70]|uniref:Propionyl-CoA carboxylase beta chain, mitochondrial n=1 Tax=Eremomyces bilateralis CBS 781.70 TaxID=1392243 RepID=A0A6G1G0A0_9PEZI|nr:propionyl-CoA carboxylase beta chain [Eremomyces bilateralis CBS 781.70]KAF1811448.1 propionyl-CoA carboxylase beta chain [Eremomyces bilateralis CBS 781.70]